jgi:hypothetical protein
VLALGLSAFVYGRVGGSADRSVVKDRIYRNVSDNADITLNYRAAVQPRASVAGLGRRSRSVPSVGLGPPVGPRCTEVGARDGRTRSREPGPWTEHGTERGACAVITRSDRMCAARQGPHQHGTNFTIYGRSITPAHSDMHPATAVRDTPALPLK